MKNKSPFFSSPQMVSFFSNYICEHNKAENVIYCCTYVEEYKAVNMEGDWKFCPYCGLAMAPSFTQPSPPLMISQSQEQKQSVCLPPSPPPEVEEPEVEEPEATMKSGKKSLVSEMMKELMKGKEDDDDCCFNQGILSNSVYGENDKDAIEEDDDEEYTPPPRIKGADDMWSFMACKAIVKRISWDTKINYRSHFALLTYLANRYSLTVDTLVKKNPIELIGHGTIKDALGWNTYNRLYIRAHTSQ